MLQLRILPVLMVCSLITLFVKLGDIYTGVSSFHRGQTTPLVGVPAAVAQETEDDLPAPDDGSALDEELSFDEDLPADGQEDLTGLEDGTTDVNFGVDPTLFTQEEIDLLQNLAVRREVISDREAELDQRESILAAAEARIDRKINEIKSLKTHIEDLIREKDRKEEEKILKLVKVYESMKPKQAAVIWNELEMPILLEVATRMREVKAADVMARMSPERARDLTGELARRQEIGELP